MSVLEHTFIPNKDILSASITYSDYKKTDVKKEIIKCLEVNNIEQGNYWVCELVCSEYFSFLWEILIKYYIENVDNVNIMYYLNVRMEYFMNICNNENELEDLDLKNNVSIRKLFMELFCILANAPKNHKKYDNIYKIQECDFNLDYLKTQFESNSSEYSNNVLQDDDPEELRIAINELCYQLHIQHNFTKSCYWVNWIIAYAKVYNIKVVDRGFLDEDATKAKQHHYIWIVWDCLYADFGENDCSENSIKSNNSENDENDEYDEYENNNENVNTSELIQSFLNWSMDIFKYNFTNANVTKYKSIIYECMHVICHTNDVDFNKPINNQDTKNKIHNLMNVFDKIYSVVVKNNLIDDST